VADCIGKDVERVTLVRPPILSYKRTITEVA
jgi:hypothetical protein